MDLSKLKSLDLFSGIGGITYALCEIVHPIAYCEIDPYCQSVLLSRMQEGILPTAPIWDDVRTLPCDELPSIEIVYGGFPCQGFSCAGVGKGLDDERSGLFREIERVLGLTSPRWVFLENVPPIVSRGGSEVVRRLAALGYDCRWCVISASSVGALHRRERWFLLANAAGAGSQETNALSCGLSQRIEWYSSRCHGNTHSFDARKIPSVSRGETSQSSGTSCDPHSITGGKADSETMSQQRQGRAWRMLTGIYRPFESRDDWQETIAHVCRTTDGLPHDVHRIKALGNGVVPQQVRRAFELLLRGL